MTFKIWMDYETCYEIVQTISIDENVYADAMKIMESYGFKVYGCNVIK